jgi:hypothetical protein
MDGCDDAYHDTQGPKIENIWLTIPPYDKHFNPSLPMLREAVKAIRIGYLYAFGVAVNRKPGFTKKVRLPFFSAFLCVLFFAVLCGYFLFNAKRAKQKPAKGAKKINHGKLPYPSAAFALKSKYYLFVDSCLN